MSTGPASRSASLPRFGRGAAVALFLLFLLLGVVFTAPLVRHLRHALPVRGRADSRPRARLRRPGRLPPVLLLPVARRGAPAVRGLLPEGPVPVRDRRGSGEPPEHLPAGRAPLRPALRARPPVRLQRPRPPVLPVRRHGRGASRPALRRLAGRRVRRRGGLRLRALPGGGLARRASRGPRVSAGPARAVGGRGRAGGIARERPRGGRRAPRARPDGAPLRVLRRPRPAALRAGARRASRVATGAPGHRPRGLAGRGRRRRSPLAYGALGALARQGWQDPLSVRPRDRRGGRAPRARDLAGAGGLAPRGRRRDGSARRPRGGVSWRACRGSSRPWPGPAAGGSSRPHSPCRSSSTGRGSSPGGGGGGLPDSR